MRSVGRRVGGACAAGYRVVLSRFQGRGLHPEGWGLTTQSDPDPPPCTRTPMHMARHVFLTGPPGDPGAAGLGGGEVVRLDLGPVSGLGGKEGQEDGGAQVSGPQRQAVTLP